MEKKKVYASGVVSGVYPTKDVINIQRWDHLFIQKQGEIITPVHPNVKVRRLVLVFILTVYSCAMINTAQKRQPLLFYLTVWDQSSQFRLTCLEWFILDNSFPSVIVPKWVASPLKLLYMAKSKQCVVVWYSSRNNQIFKLAFFLPSYTL